jgi:signal peptidase
MGKAVKPEVPQRTGRDFGGRRGSSASTQILEIQRQRRFIRAGRLANYMALLVLLFAAVVLVAVPQATGCRTYMMQTNSMAPTYPPGTFLVVKPAAFSQLKYGDIITFQSTHGGPAIETRRVVGFGMMPNGEKTLITKGDNREANDAEPVLAQQIRGKLLYAVPFAGYLANAVGDADRDLWMTVAVGALVFLSALLAVLGARRRRREG